LLSGWISERKPSAEIKQTIPIQTFRIGRLEDVLLRLHDESDINVVAAVKRLETNMTPISGIPRKPYASAVIYLPLGKTASSKYLSASR
jgi:hypothetical protein